MNGLPNPAQEPPLPPHILDGKAVSQATLARVAREAAALGVTPGLAVVLVGADPASQVYVGAKGKAAKECGFHSLQFDLPETTSEAELLALVDKLNADPAIHGILVQLPLPKAIDAARVLEAIAPAQGRRRLPSRSTSASRRSARSSAR